MILDQNTEVYDNFPGYWRGALKKQPSGKRVHERAGMKEMHVVLALLA